MNPRSATLSPPVPPGEAPFVLCHGLVASDFLTRTSFPIPRDLKVRVDAFLRQGGGPAANAAVGLSRLGIRTAFVGAVGEDGLGREQLDDLTRENVDVSGVVVLRGTPSFVAFILVDESDGSRTIYSAPDDRPLCPDGAPPLPDDPPHLLLVDGWGGPHQMAACRAARDLGIPVLIDAGSDRPEIREMLPLADIAIVSAPFSDDWTGPGREGDTIRRLLDQGARLAAVTRGDQSVVAGAAGSPLLFEVGVERIEPVDTTGAGDAFHAGTAWGLLEGRSWEASLRNGAQVAARKCLVPGARAGLPRRAALEREGLA